MEANSNPSHSTTPSNYQAVYVPIAQSLLKGAKLSNAISIDWKIGKDKLKYLNDTQVAVGVANGIIKGIFTLKGYHKSPNGRIVLELGDPVYPEKIGLKAPFTFYGSYVHFDILP